MRTRTIVAGTAALALLAGCGTSGGGTTGSPTNAPQPTSGSNSAGAPKIKSPLDVKAFEADPCSTVTAAQVQAFGLPGVNGRNNTTELGPGCMWLGSSTPARMAPGVAFLPDDTNLSTILPNKDTTYEKFEQLPDIQGYPAYMALVSDQRSGGNCSVLTAVADTKAVLFTFQSDKGSPRYADPCGAVTEFADLAIGTMKAGAK
ncbi:DUF3558 domain-containing protein [Lentzea flava]|uniref:DUF3558 domain-containing protein n=1 Tax=Lentzea flava TaxID=103732 RepID=A0ABQ2VBU7_9PSEU|nr:DUF3558 domain-containing protein [Lentzea flava]MCP2204264.1 Protein of unknown function (DUF3558) [Lentzea flava]GGU75896.1 hypothetical protein GCM10010178_79000 [Lentzea flava]